MKVADFMRIDVVTARPNMNVSDVASQMVRSHISGMPVVDDDDTVIGIVTEGDLLRRAEVGTDHHRRRLLQFLMGPARLADEYVKSHARMVKDVMTADVALLDPQDSLDTAVDLMERRGIKRVPVVSDGKLIGILSRADVLAAYVYKVRSSNSSGATDGEIRKSILDAFEKEKWLRGDRLAVVVRDGEVELTGAVMSENERKALTVMASSIEGVRRVSDKLTYIDPIALTPAM
jgi:CBS domain-containing protein